MDTSETNGQTVDQAVDKPKKPYTIEHIYQFERNGMTFADIGQYYGVSKQAISQKIKAFEKMLNLHDREAVEAYRRFTPEILEGAGFTFLTAALDKKRLKKASSRDCMVNYGISVDKKRLIAGESTANLAIHQIVEAIEREGQSRPPRELGADEQE